MITAAREIAYRLDPVLWVREVLGVTPHAWQERFLRARRGQCIAALTARQVGKSTVAALGYGTLCIVRAGIVIRRCQPKPESKCRGGTQGS